MFLKLPISFYALWIAHPILQVSVALIIWRRKLYRTFPVFFAYLVSQVVTFLTLFPIFQWGTYEYYFYGFWILQAVTLAVGFKVIHEIFLDVFRPYHALKDLGSVLFKWAALVMLLVACVIAAASPAGQEGPLVQAVLTVQRCIRVIQCGLILFLLVFSKYLGVSWRQHSFGIALGFGGFASVELTMIALNTSGHASEMAVSMFSMAAYNLAIVTWLAYAWQKAPARTVSAKQLMTQRWNQSLTDLQHPVEADSLIPMFEGIVDRAFSRTEPDHMHSGSKDAQNDDSIATPVSRLAKSARSGN